MGKLNFSESYSIFTKSIRYILVICFVSFFSCNDSNVTNSSIDSTSIDYNNSQSSEWVTSISSITTKYAPQRNNMTDGVLYHTNTFIQKFSDPLYDGSSNLIYSNEPPTVADNYMAYIPSGSNKIWFGIIAPASATVQTSAVSGAESNIGPAIVKYQGDLYIFHKGNGNHKIYSLKSTNGGNSWGSDTEISGSKTNATPSATVFKSRIYLFYKDKDNNTIHYKYMFSNGSWSSEFSLSSSESRTPETPTVRTNPIENKLYLIYRGEDKYVYYRTMNTSENWTSQTFVNPVNSDPPKTKSAPDIYFLVEGTFITLRQKDSNKIVTMYKSN